MECAFHCRTVNSYESLFTFTFYRDRWSTLFSLLTVGNDFKKNPNLGFICIKVTGSHSKLCHYYFWGSKNDSHPQNFEECHVMVWWLAYHINFTEVPWKHQSASKWRKMAPLREATGIFVYLEKMSTFDGLRSYLELDICRPCFYKHIITPKHALF